MQRCSLCGGRVVNGRCEDCGMPIPPEHEYAPRDEEVHTHEVNGERVMHRVRTDARHADAPRDDEEPHRFGRRRASRTGQKRKISVYSVLTYIVLILIIIFNLWPLLH